MVNGFAKVTACVYRPWIMDSRVHPVKEAIAGATGYSFPSGHATSATFLFLGPVLRGKFSKALNIGLICCFILVAFSRNYVGVHSILDVIFAFIFTFIVLIIISKLFDKLEFMCSYSNFSFDSHICIDKIISYGLWFCRKVNCWPGNPDHWYIQVCGFSGSNIHMVAYWKKVYQVFSWWKCWRKSRKIHIRLYWFNFCYNCHITFVW